MSWNVLATAIFGVSRSNWLRATIDI